MVGEEDVHLVMEGEGDRVRETLGEREEEVVKL